MAFEHCSLREIKSLSPSVKNFVFSYPAEWSSRLVSGQFVMLDLPIQHEFTTRSYSIASAPTTEGFIELCIVKKPGGAGTNYLFDEATVGQRLMISEPLGKFVLEDSPNDLCFICTGTGIAPFRSMIWDLYNKSKLNKPVHLVFGNRKEEDILYRKEWEELQLVNKNFLFHPVLSQADPSWQGYKGYVHSVYEDIARKNPETDFYICGWSAMVKEAKNNLKAMGFGRKQIKFELYD